MNANQSESTVTDIALGKAKASAKLERSVPPWIAPVVAIAIFALLAVLGVALTTGYVTTLTAILFYVAIAAGWNLLGGNAGYLNFGAAFFMGAGAYAAAWMSNQGDVAIWMTLVPAAAVAVLLSAIVGFATLRLRSHYFAIFTLVLTFLAAMVARNTPALGSAHGLFVHLDLGGRNPNEIAMYFFWWMFGIAVVAVAIGYLVQRSRFGHALRAVKEDEPAAQVLGVKTVSVKLWALAIGAALAGAAGAVYAFMTAYIEPAGTFDLSIALDIVLVCVIGGLGHWLGPLIGAVIVVALEQWLRVVLPGINLFGWNLPHETNRLILGILLLVFALFIRRGIVGLFAQNRGRKLSI